MSRVLPILFNGDMVRAILDGRKTVTRRVMKNCSIREGQEVNKNLRGKFELYKITPRCGISQGIIFKPPFQPGDILYVRETWGISNMDYDDKVAYIVYKASENEKEEGCRAIRFTNDRFEKLYDSMAWIPDWRPSIHMPKQAARIWLKVTDVRVERLQEIMKDPPGPNNQVVREGCTYGCDFIAVWENTIKKSEKDLYGWDANPWVWVIEFEQCKKPEE